MKAKDKKKHLSNKYSTMSKVRKTEFSWTNYEISYTLNLWINTYEGLLI